MILPSKELLSEALNYNVNIIDDTTNNEIIYNDGLYINIYELQHLMKEWAWKKDYAFILSPNELEIYSLIDGVSKKRFWDEEDMPYSISLVFKACEWILANKDKK